jgi:hypothetical protein
LLGCHAISLRDHPSYFLKIFQSDIDDSLVGN